MKIVGKLFNWFVLPGAFAVAMAVGDDRYAQMGSAFLWAVSAFLIPASLLMLIGFSNMKPDHPKWEENRKRFLEDRPWIITRVIAWFALLVTIALAAFNGFVFTAIFYFMSVLWARLCWVLARENFTKQGNVTA